MTIKLGLVGTGTVGGGCIDILQKHKEDFKRHYGIDVELARVCSRDPKQAEAHGVSDLFTLDYHDIVNDPDIDIVIELIGGTTVARDVVVSALEAGKNVVTANKALMATHGEEVMHLAEKMNRELAFEASVGGGIPIIDPLKHSLISNEITSVMGIVNGTTNYMLTRMVDDNLSYDEALKEAQERGFAEADPTADVDGFDAAAKIAILASIAFNSRVTLDDVHTEGIRNITTLDLDTADDMGYVIKLLAIAHRTPDGIDVRVHPTMLPKAHQLATVNGVFNAIYVTGDAVGETMWATCSRWRAISRWAFPPSWDAPVPTTCPSFRWRICRRSTISALPWPTAPVCSLRWRACSPNTASPCAPWCSAATPSTRR